MRKYILLIFIITNALSMNSLSSCPCGFSPEDTRPFFEQYEGETSTITTPQEKEESS